MRPEADFTWVTVSYPLELASGFVLKGSVAVDGISLTVARLTDDQFDVQIVPHTETHTTMRGWRPGTAVNLECDVIGKYVARAWRWPGRGRWCNSHDEACAFGAPPRSATNRLHLAAGRRTAPPFAPIDEAIAAIRAGKMVVVVDDEDRENEGDLTIAAERVTPDDINFMVTHGRGLVCLAMTPERLDELEIPLEVPVNSSLRETAMCVSIDARGKTTTGISAADRAATILTAIAPDTRPQDLLRPGHVFPLRARQGGVLVRSGHTEAAVDLARLAGLDPSGVICEIMSKDGTMARVPELAKFARRHGLLLVTIADLIKYRMRTERLVRKVAEARLPTEFGHFQVVAFESPLDGETHIALVRGEMGDGAGRDGPRPFQVPHRRRLPLGALRLRPAAAGRDAAHRRRRTRRAPLPEPGGPGHRPGQQDPRVRAAGPGPRHRRGQRAAGFQGRSARLRDRRPDPGRPGRPHHASADE